MSCSWYVFCENSGYALQFKKIKILMRLQIGFVPIVGYKSYKLEQKYLWAHSVLEQI